MFTLLTTLLALPVLGLICVPLLISAWITVIFALFTLFIRLSVVYVELVYEFVTNLFALPAITSSLLTFAPSEPATPAAGNSRRNSAFGLTRSRKSQDSLSSWSIIEAQDDTSKRSQKTYARSMVEAHNLPTGFSLPVSGDEWRDFEGVGGWRSCSKRPNSKNGSNNPNDKPVSSISSSSAQSAMGDRPDAIDDDERAWLSLNDRLELPSQVITWGTSSNIASPTNMDSFSPRGSFSHGMFPISSPRFYHTQPHNGQRHHQRSHTTSSLTSSEHRARNGLSLTLSSRPDHAGLARESGHTVSPSASRLAPFMTPQPYPTFRSSRTMPATTATNGMSNSFDGGYFALQRPGYHYVPSLETRESPNWSGYATPGSEDRDVVSFQPPRLMSHYPTSARHRRRSISGPHARLNAVGGAN